MDIKLFYKKNGGVVQLVEEAKINEWALELPIIFVEYIRNTKLKTYRDTKVEGEVSAYLDKIMKDLAIPKIQDLFGKGIPDDIISLLDVFEELSETNARAVGLVQKEVESLINNSNKSINSRAKRIINNLKR